MKLEDSRIVLTGAASGIEQDSRRVLPITGIYQYCTRRLFAAWQRQ